LEVSGLAARRAEALGVRSWHVSLTHTESLAAAVVVAD
jgi:holo-[acyl-carrier protein] synthase